VSYPPSSVTPRRLADGGYSYGFVPVWRLHGTNPSVTVQAQNASQQASPGTGAQGALNNLFCLPKLLSHLRSSPTPTSPPPGIDDPPPLPPKDTVTAPTPRTNPYTWLVPETAPVLEGFLSLIYPSGTFTPFPTDPLITLELTGRVIRAALGYQSAKALALARDHMSGFMMDRPVDVYAMASFFKFTDLSKLASQHGIGVPSSDWGGDTRALLGRGALARLEELQGARMGGLREIVNKEMEVDEHSAGCGKRGRLEEVWKAKVRELELGLRPDSELFELLAIDLSGEHCENCLVQLGMTIQRCLYEARELPRSV